MWLQGVFMKEMETPAETGLTRKQAWSSDEYQ